MKALMCVVVTGVVLAGTTVDAGQGRGQGRGNDERPPAAAPNRPAQVNLVFSPREVTLIRTHYAQQYRNLPPGLHRKLARGGQLPPGWQKTMQPFPAALERDLIVLPSGRARGVFDGHAVIYDPLTHAILDIVSLF